MATSKPTSKPIDPEIAEFEAALLRSIDQANAGLAARMHSPEDIVKRRRGRPVGTKKATPKIATGVRFDADVLEALKASGRGWQTRVNAIVRKAVLG
jgi:uncharacterized protein (DUF4415 family)